MDIDSQSVRGLRIRTARPADVMYQVYPLSFAAVDGKGRPHDIGRTGNLAGVTEKLDYIKSIGVDTIWLSPLFASPMADHGYDVKDYWNIDPTFGTMEDFDELIAEALTRDIDICLDFVLNHVSAEHEWFQEARRSPADSPAWDKFILRRGRGEHGEIPPTDQGTMLEPAVDGKMATAWGRIPDPAVPGDFLKDSSGNYVWYLATFDKQQPDLNWNSEVVQDEMNRMLEFWLQKGVKGGRFDVVHLIGRPPDFAQPGFRFHADPDRATEIANDFLRQHMRPDLVRPHLQRIEALFGRYGARTMIYEISARSPTSRAPFIGDGPASSFEMEFLNFINRQYQREPATFDGTAQAAAGRSALQRTVDVVIRAGKRATFLFENHDKSRLSYDHPRNGRAGSQTRADAMNTFLTGLPGTVVIYQGQELGTPNLPAPDDMPGYRGGPRGRIRHDGAENAGWPESDVQYWERLSPDPSINVAAEDADPNSSLHLMRRGIALRHEFDPTSKSDTMHVYAQDAGEDVIGFRVGTGRDKQTRVLNLSDEPRQLRMRNFMIVQLSSDRGPTELPLANNVIPGNTGMVLRPVTLDDDISAMVENAYVGDGPSPDPTYLIRLYGESPFASRLDAQMQWLTERAEADFRWAPVMEAICRARGDTVRERNWHDIGAAQHEYETPMTPAMRNAVKGAQQWLDGTLYTENASSSTSTTAIDLSGEFGPDY